MFLSVELSFATNISKIHKRIYWMNAIAGLEGLSFFCVTQYKAGQR